MPKEILCPICGASYNLADAQLGRKVRCKKCEHTFTAGGEQGPDDEEDDSPRSRKSKKGRDRDEDDDDRPKRTKSLAEQVKQREQQEPGMPVSSFVILGIVAAVILICGGSAGLYFLLHMDKPAATQHQGNPPKKR